jgi:hypothetical protein
MVFSSYLSSGFSPARELRLPDRFVINAQGNSLVLKYVEKCSLSTLRISRYVAAEWEGRVYASFILTRVLRKRYRERARDLYYDARGLPQQFHRE